MKPISQSVSAACPSWLEHPSHCPLRRSTSWTGRASCIHAIQCGTNAKGGLKTFFPYLLEMLLVSHVDIPLVIQGQALDRCQKVEGLWPKLTTTCLDTAARQPLDVGSCLISKEISLPYTPIISFFCKLTTDHSHAGLQADMLRATTSSLQRDCTC